MNIRLRYRKSPHAQKILNFSLLDHKIPIKDGKTLFFLRRRGLRVPLSADECLCTARWWKSDHPFHHQHIRTDLSGYIQIKIHKGMLVRFICESGSVIYVYVIFTKLNLLYRIIYGNGVRIQSSRKSRGINFPELAIILEMKIFTVGKN